ncbi:MAG TPA: hypothetical protein VIG50_11330 [Vicinamibacteria bacterium]
MKALRARHVVAFDASGVAGATLAWGLGAPRARAFAHAPLPPGALWPSPFEPNARRRAEVEAAAREVALSLRLGGAPVCLVLPDGVARLSDLDVPSDTSPVAFARYRLGPTLPYPADEAVIDVLPLGGRRVLAAAVRREVLRDYEDVAAAAGLCQERVDLAPLGALAALAAVKAEAPTVDVVLGDAAYSLALRGASGVRAVRNRRRDASAGEWRRLRAEAERTAALDGQATDLRLRLVGAGALSLVGELRAAGAAADAGWRVAGDVLPGQGAELGWLGTALG